jgi:hypothetical protein
VFLIVFCAFAIEYIKDAFHFIFIAIAFALQVWMSLDKGAWVLLDHLVSHGNIKCAFQYRETSIGDAIATFAYLIEPIVDLIVLDAFDVLIAY